LLRLVLAIVSLLTVPTAHHERVWVPGGTVLKENKDPDKVEFCAIPEGCYVPWDWKKHVKG
jgi:hypothetical protein